MSSGKEQITTREIPGEPIRVWLRLDFIKEGEI